MDTKLKVDEFPLKVGEPTAEWHLPVDEAGQIRRSPRENLWQRGLGWLFLVSGFVAFVLTARNITSVVGYAVSLSQAFVLMGISQAVLIYLYRRLSQHVDVGTGFRRLKSKVPEDVSLMVRVDVVRDGCLTGRDEGFMWLNEGTWYFKGLQTAFRFNQNDVVPIEAWPKRISPDPAHDKPPTLLPMKSVHGQLELRVNVIDPHVDFAKRKQVREFYRELYDWLVERPRGAIESLLPPLDVHPDLHRTDLARFEGLAAGLAMVLIDSGVLFGLPREGRASAIAAVLATVLLAAGIRLAWLEYRDLTVRARLSKKELPDAN